MINYYKIIGLICLISFCKTIYGDTTLPTSASTYEGLVDIGHGRKMFLECRGSGLPTVIFISGRTDSSTIWDTATDPSTNSHTVFSEVAKFTRACAYDRPGTVTITKQNAVVPSRSTSTQQPVTPKSGVDDLHALLKATKIPGPYLLVAHSYGGLIARLYASTYPEEIAGLALVDTLSEFLYDALTPSQQALWIKLNSNYSSELEQYVVQERTDFVPSFNQLRTAPPLKIMPAIVLTSGQSYNFQKLIDQGVLPADTPLDFETVVFQAHLKGQQQLANLLKAKQISTEHAGHYIHTEQPQLVIDAIRQIIEQIRNKKETGIR